MGDDGLMLSYVRLDELQADPDNPKDHDLGALHGSLDVHGYVEPVIRDGRTGRLVAGHGRTETLAQKMAEGQSPPEGVRVDGDGVWMVPVVDGWQSRSDADARRLLLALNRTTELGGWHDDALAGLLERLAEDEGGLAGSGFDGDDLDELRARLNGPLATDDQSGMLSDQYAVYVECETDSQQRELLDRLSAEGYTCRALM